MWGTIGAYLLTTAGGFGLVGGCLTLVQRTIGKTSYNFFEWGTFWTGITERVLATTLVIWAPKMVPVFIGGWIALKIAAGWSREPGGEKATGHLTALLGSAFSFAVAIWAGLLINPGAVETWNE